MFLTLCGFLYHDSSIEKHKFMHRYTLLHMYIHKYIENMLYNFLWVNYIVVKDAEGT